MKAKRREILYVFLPFIGFLLWAVIYTRLNSSAKPKITVHSQAETLQPEPTWEETDTRIRTTMQTSDSGALARIRAYQNYFTSTGYAYRWHYNSRIEGMYRGRRVVFYSSNENNDWDCWYASSQAIDWSKHEFRERFSLRKIPEEASDLTYHIEVVAFKSRWIAGEWEDQDKIQQMRHWKNVVGYASHAIPLKR